MATPGTEELDVIEAALEACSRQPHDLPAVMELSKHVPRLAILARTMRRLRQELLAEPATPRTRGRDLEAEVLIIALEREAGGRSALRQQLRAVARDTPGVGELAGIEATLSAFSRQPYDLSVVTQLSAQVPDLTAMVAAMRRLRQQPRIPGRGAATAQGRPVPSRVVRPPLRDVRAESRRPRRAIAAGTGILATLIAVIAALLIHPGQRQGTASPAAAFALSMSGAHVGQGYASGQVVHLRWRGPVKAAVYRLQIARSRSPRPRPFAAPGGRIILTDHPSYRLRVVGAQLYYWRVQAFYGASWHAPSRTQVFAVTRPTIGVPAPLRPRKGTTLRPGRIALCWSRVPGAAAYRLSLDGRRVGGIGRQTCGHVLVRSGEHQWNVAATVQAAETYTGPTSRPARFLAKAPRPRRSRPSHRAAHARRSRHSVVAPTEAAVSSGPIAPVLRPAPAPQSLRPVYRVAPAPRSVHYTSIVPPPTVRRVVVAAATSLPAHRHAVAHKSRASRRLLPPPPPPRPALGAPTVTALLPPPPPPPPSSTPHG